MLTKFAQTCDQICSKQHIAPLTKQKPQGRCERGINNFNYGCNIQVFQ
nr:MAG TPA: hypothetical protein [Herelleviridae sp.]